MDWEVDIWWRTIVEFPYIVGQAVNLDALNFVEGNSASETSIEIVWAIGQEINLPDVQGCEWQDLEAN